MRAYLPLGSEDYVIQIRTHLLREAERIGNGAVTEGLALLAIEHVGSPKSVANEYAGTGKRIGPLPVKYARPVAALTIVFIGIGLAVMLGLFLVEPVLPGVTSVFSASALFLALVLASIVTALVVTERLNILDMRRTEAERTLFERVLGIGEEALRKKSAADAFVEYAGSLIIAVLLILPQVRILFTSVFLPFVPVLIGLRLFGSVVGPLFFLRGENNFTLALEVVLGVAWIVVSAMIVHIGWPLRYMYIYDGTTLGLFDIVSFMAQVDLTPSPLLIIWVMAIFVAVASSTWRAISGIAKISWYMREERGLWWDGRASPQVSRTQQ